MMDFSYKKKAMNKLIAFFIFFTCYIFSLHTSSAISSQGEELEEDLDHLAHDMEVLNKETSALSDSPLSFDLINQLKTKITSGMEKEVMEMIKNNPFQYLPRSQVEGLIKKTLEEKIGRNLAPGEYGNFIQIMTDLLIHPRALGDLLSILFLRDKLKIYLGALIAGFIAYFIVGFLVRAKVWWKRLSIKMLTSFSLSLFNLLFFYFLFKVQLSPTLSIVWERMGMSL